MCYVHSGIHRCDIDGKPALSTFRWVWLRAHVLTCRIIDNDPTQVCVTLPSNKQLPCRPCYTCCVSVLLCICVHAGWSHTTRRTTPPWCAVGRTPAARTSSACTCSSSETPSPTTPATGVSYLSSASEQGPQCVLCCAVLCYAMLYYCVVLCGVVLCHAVY
jgi:hypothetical protein